METMRNTKSSSNAHSKGCFAKNYYASYGRMQKTHSPYYEFRKEK